MKGPSFGRFRGPSLCVLLAGLACCAGHNGDAGGVAATGQAATYEGYGSPSVGGAGGDVYHVTALEGGGPGTLSHGIQNRTGPRTIVFDVGGTLILPQGTRITEGLLTIDGATAPAPGITIKQTWARNGFGIEAQPGAPVHDVILSGLRFEGAWSGSGDEGGGDDLFGLDGEEGEIYNIVIDHCTFTNAADGTVDITNSVRDVTVQWSLFHGNPFTMLIKYGTRQRISLHHNVYARNGERNPQVKGNMRTLDFRNNIVYDWTLPLDANHQDGYGLRLWSAASGSDSPGVPSVNVIGNAFLARNASDGCGIQLIEDSAPVQRWLADNLALPSPLCVSSNLPDPIPIPAYARITTWPAGDLARHVLPGVGMKYRNSVEQSLLDRIGRVPVWNARP